ncbi:uncharacterized protein LOC142242024 isoform X3 [Haematobia irritans]|uniref:uncharacterized protein LOC142234131 isoform X3 n=1 Tax=Haematobia irritans TaxID=7368 RepID=UPI003F4FB96C
MVNYSCQPEPNIYSIITVSMAAACYSTNPKVMYTTTICSTSYASTSTQPHLPHRLTGTATPSNPGENLFAEQRLQHINGHTQIGKLSVRWQ